MSRRALAITVISIASTMLLISVVMPTPADAQYKRYAEGFTIIPDECINQEAGTECGLNSFVQLFVNLAQVGLKLLPYVAMIMLIWAGFDLIMAGGSQEKISGGKKFVSSIALGILIVTILAWAWSFFVVYILTCDSSTAERKEATCGGVLFSGYGVWEKEFWGGGEVAAPLPGSGCCVVNDLGCTDVTKEDCDGIYASYLILAGVSPEYSWQGENQFCEGITQCQNYQYGCCTPRANDGSSCYNPNERGCLDYPATEFQTTQCANIAPCQGNTLGEATQNTTTGCCVTGNSCSSGNSDECFGTFLPGQNCSAVTECTTGCCVADNACSNGKINCSGTWNAAACDQAPNDTDCQVGCCIADASTNHQSCYTSMTVAGCIATYGGDTIFNPSFPDCTGNLECTNGCCTSTASCSPGNIDGRCPNPATGYDTSVLDSCASNASCQIGCCLYNNATSCVDGVQQSNCSNAGDNFIGPGSCATYGDCTTGCCKDVINNGGACIDGYAATACGGAPNTFYSGQTCAAAGCV